MTRGSRVASALSNTVDRAEMSAVSRFVIWESAVGRMLTRMARHRSLIVSSVLLAIASRVAESAAENGPLSFSEGIHLFSGKGIGVGKRGEGVSTHGEFDDRQLELLDGRFCVCMQLLLW